MSGSFKFSLVSDLHVNHPHPKFPYNDLEEFVIVAGDTSDGLEGLKFLNKLKRKGHKVYAIDGNHEHYSNVSQRRSQHKTEWDFKSGLDQQLVVDLAPGLRIIGCNGWYPVSDAYAWNMYQNDHRYTGIMPEEMNLLAVQHAEHVRAHLEETNSKAIVVTHTAPTTLTLDPKYAGHYSNEWYWNPALSEILQQFSDKILVWCHGHTHAACDRSVWGVRVVCHPRGCPGECLNWRPKTIEVLW